MNNFNLENDREWACTTYANKGHQTLGMIKCNQNQDTQSNFIILDTVEQICQIICPDKHDGKIRPTGSET